MSDGVDRPFLVTVISVLYIVLAVILLAGGALILAGGVMSDIEGSTLLGELGGGALLVFGLIVLVIGAGLYRGWKIMWYLGVLFAIIGALSSLISIVSGSVPSVVPLAITLIIVWYLFRKNVKSFFLD